MSPVARFIPDAVGGPHGRWCDLAKLEEAGPGALAFGYVADGPSAGHAWEFHNCDGAVVGGLLALGRWTVTATDPLTVSPSIHCVAAQGGCGLHGWIREGRWTDA